MRIYACLIVRETAPGFGRAMPFAGRIGMRIVPSIVPEVKRSGIRPGVSAEVPSSGRGRFVSTLVVSLAFVVGSLVVAVCIGAVNVPLSTVWRVIAAHTFGSSRQIDPVDNRIVWDFRLPRALIGFAVGAGLSLAGVVIQSVVRNPLGDPYLLGIMSGASAGAVAVIVLGVSATRGGVGVQAGLHR